MLNANINYPYPVIRDYTEDYKTTTFKGELTVNIQPNNYVIHPNFQISNSGISELLSSGVLTYAIEIQSPSTWFRKLFLVNDNKPIFLDTTFLHERIELTPCIVAVESFSNFTNDDFEEEYQGMTFDINVGDVIAIGEKRTFDALYQNDIIKHGSSIVNIKGNDKLKEIMYDYSGNVIEIILPIAQHNTYIECGYSKAKYKPLNAILTIPVLVEAISIIANDENDSDNSSGYESKSWYKTIVVNLKRLAENNEVKYRQLLSKPFASAELLLDNNYISALDYINNVN